MRLNDELRKQRIIDSEQRVPLIERDSYVSEWYAMKRIDSGAKLSKTGEMITIVVCLIIIIFMVSMILYGTVFRDSDKFAKFMGVFMYEVFYVSAFLMSLRFYKRGQGFITVYDPVRNIVSMMIFGLGVILVVPLYLFLNKEYILFPGLPSLYFLSAFLFTATEKQRLYTRKAVARCIGYSRRISHTRRLGYRCYTSPVFEIEVNGEKTEVLYDREDLAWNSAVELYSTVTVDRHKDDPTRILSPGKLHMFLMLIPAVFSMLILVIILLGSVLKFS